MTTDSTTITFAPTTGTQAAEDGAAWTDALSEYTEYDFESGTANEDLKLKSSRWLADSTVAGITVGAHSIGAVITVDSNGAFSVDYNPASVKDGANA